MKTGLIDYGAGNLQSVRNALRLLGKEALLISKPEEMRLVDALIFPGVGAFGDSMKHLQEQGLVEPLRDWIRGGRPFLGICIGYQVLFENGEESPGIDGLGVFKGSVIRIKAEGLKVPHMGWNPVEISDPSDPLWSGLGSAPHFYFVHSYHPQPADESLIAAKTTYGAPFASAIRWATGAAVQFHPEKSQKAGLKLIDNFLTHVAPGCLAS